MLNKDLGKNILKRSKSSFAQMSTFRLRICPLFICATVLVFWCKCPTVLRKCPSPDMKHH